MDSYFSDFNWSWNWLHFHWKHIKESDAVVQTKCLNHFPIQRQMIWTSDQPLPTSVKLFSCCCPGDDILPWDPVHLQSMRVSGYCIFSIGVPNDMTITDAGHESKVLNHPASWCVQQVLLSDLLWILNIEAPHRNAHDSQTSSTVLVCAVSSLPGAGLHLSLARTTPTVPALCELSSVNAMTPSNQPSLRGRRRGGKKKSIQAKIHAAHIKA